MPACVAPAVTEYVPAPHAMHVLDEDAPEAVEYVPAEHCRQPLARLAPTAAEYAPASHEMHTPDCTAPAVPE